MLEEWRGMGRSAVDASDKGILSMEFAQIVLISDKHFGAYGKVENMTCFVMGQFLSKMKDHF